MPVLETALADTTDAVSNRPLFRAKLFLWFSIEGSGFVVVHDPSGRRFSVMPVAEALAGSGAGRYGPR